MKTKREQFLTVIRALIGTPYAHQGRSLKGVDCVGLNVLAYNILGWDVKDYKSYTEIVGPDILVPELEKACELRLKGHSPKDAENGDILVFQVGNSVRHMGVKDGNEFIHSTKTLGSVLPEPLTRKWLNRVRGVYTHV